MSDSADNANGRAEDAADAMSEGMEVSTPRSIGDAVEAPSDARRFVDEVLADREPRSESPWNLLLERKLGLDLTVEESRYVDGVARLTLGFQGREYERLGDKLVRETTRLHGRSLEVVRASVERKGLILFERGRRGRGQRSLYVLVLDEKTGPDRPFTADDEKTGPERSYSLEKTGEKTGKKTGPDRGRSMDKGENTKCSRPTNEGTVEVVALRRADEWVEASPYDDGGPL